MAASAKRELGQNGQHLLGLKLVVGLHTEIELVRAAHALGHREAGAEGRLLARRNGRRTDNRFGRSAANDGLYAHGLVDDQGCITDVRECELGVDGLTELLLAEV